MLAGWPVCANHFWSRGAVAEMIKKGNPIDTKRTMNNQGMGVVAVGGVRLQVCRPAVSGDLVKEAPDEESIDAVSRAIL
jgi:hypothetical protein